MASFFRSGRFDDREIEIGVWRNNRSGPWFLDWFAEHRCAVGEELWDYCKHDAQRWSGRGVDLFALFADDQVFEPTDAELDDAYAQGPDEARLLLEIAAITNGEWTGTVDSERPHRNDWVAERLAVIGERASL